MIPEPQTAQEVMAHYRAVKQRAAVRDYRLLHPPLPMRLEGMAGGFLFAYGVVGLAAARIGGDGAICRKIMAATARISDKGFLAHDRSMTLAIPRYACTWLMCRMTARSLHRIGELLNGRDHTTVINSCRRVAAEPARYQPVVDAICADLGWPAVAIAASARPC